ncbi:MAG: LamG-like jellyroll fold domain-containing protein [Methylococcales bacterium]
MYSNIKDNRTKQNFSKKTRKQNNLAQIDSAYTSHTEQSAIRSVNLSTHFKQLLGSFFALFLFSGHLFAGSVNLAWDASTSTNVAGYTISYGQSSNNYTVNVDAKNVTSYTINGLQDGVKYYFAVKAYDAAKTTTSGYSNEINMLTPVAPTPVPTVIPTPTPTVVPTPIPSIVPTVIPTIVPTAVPTPAPTATPKVLAADFTANKTSGAPGLVVNFTPVTSGTFSKWQWSFAGSSKPSVTTSTAKTITVTYPYPGTFSVSLTASGASGSAAKIKSNLITIIAPTPVPTATPNPVPVPTPGSVTIVNGLVAAYSFNETNGVTAIDSSGKGNHGTITEAVRIDTASKYGKALKFDGINDLVTVNDSASLGLTNSMTLEAWVYSENLNKSGQTVILKEKSNGAVYNLYANEDANLPVSSFNDGNYRVISGSSQLPANQPTHLASTYDGQYLRIYVNGIEIAKKVQTGLIQQSSGKLTIGGNSIWGEYFQGYIDEVRVYNRALTAAEIAKDLATPISLSTPAVAGSTTNVSTPTSASNLTQIVIGNTTIEPLVDHNPQGSAEAFQTVSQNSGVITTLQVYLDTSSTATELVAGIYKDNNGHPGTLVGQGKLSTLKAGAWNSVSIPATAVTANETYWIAILGTQGEIRFRDRMGSGVNNLETSASSTLTSLPDTWSTGSVYLDAPISAYGVGY